MIDGTRVDALHEDAGNGMSGLPASMFLKIEGRIMVLGMEGAAALPQRLRVLNDGASDTGLRVRHQMRTEDSGRHSSAGAGPGPEEC